MVAEPGHVVIVEPHAMCDGEMRPEYAQRIEVGGLGHAVDADAGYRLNLRLGNMAVQCDIELASEIGAAPDESIRAMMRDRRRHRRAYLLAVERPAGAVPRASLISSPRPAAGATRRRPVCNPGGKASIRPGIASKNCGRRPSAPPPRACRDRHRLARRSHPFSGRQRPFERQIVAGGATLHDHLDRTRWVVR